MGIALAFATGSSSPAHAHPPPFYRMPDLSAHSRIGIEAVPTIGDVAGDRALVVDTGLFAEISLAHWLVLAGRVPLAYVDSDPGGAGPQVSSFALGNVGLGLRLAGSSQPRRHRRWRYGLSTWVHAPTASDSGEAGAAAAISGAFTVPDHDRYIDATTLRVDLDGRYETHHVFLQGEIGLAHRRLAGDDDTDGRLGLGAGVALDPYFAVLAELTLHADELDRDAITPVLDAGLRYHNPAFMTGLRVYWPLGEAQRDAGIIGLGIDVAVRF